VHAQRLRSGGMAKNVVGGLVAGRRVAMGWPRSLQIISTASFPGD
jgi:hypothetical protein